MPKTIKVIQRKTVQKSSSNVEGITNLLDDLTEEYTFRNVILIDDEKKQLLNLIKKQEKLEKEADKKKKLITKRLIQYIDNSIDLEQLLDNLSWFLPFIDMQPSLGLDITCCRNLDNKSHKDLKIFGIEVYNLKNISAFIKELIAWCKDVKLRVMRDATKKMLPSLLEMFFLFSQGEEDRDKIDKELSAWFEFVKDDLNVKIKLPLDNPFDRPNKASVIVDILNISQDLIRTDWHGKTQRSDKKPPHISTHTFRFFNKFKGMAETTLQKIMNEMDLPFKGVLKDVVDVAFSEYDKLATEISTDESPPLLIP